MSTVLSPPRSAVVVGALTMLDAVLDGMDVEAWAEVDAAVLAECVTRLRRIEGRVRAQTMAASRALDATDTAKAQGATSTASLIADDFGGDRRGEEGLVRQAKAMASASATEKALAAGTISPKQAAVIAGAMTSLPEGVTAEQRAAVERGLLADAGRLRLPDLRRRALRAVEAFASRDEADAAENETLEQREKAAWMRSELWITNDGDGTCRGGFRLPEAAADALMAAVRAFCAPRRDHLHEHPGALRAGVGEAGESVYDRDLAHRTRLGMGLAELCQHLPADLPSTGGLGTTLLVSLDYETLRDGVRPATLSSGTRISAGEARRLACTARIIPQVFGGASVPLDHGRARRLHTEAQRQAMVRRDGGCTAPGCDKPPEHCEAHHGAQAWAAGGGTDVEGGFLVCPFHHRVALHQQGWRTRFSPDDGHVEWRKPGRDVWQRNHRWRP